MPACWRPELAGGFRRDLKAAAGEGFPESAYIYMVIGVVGTTIAPWMQFYLQSSIVEKGITSREYRASRSDVIIGCLFTDVVAWFIIVACAATLYLHGARRFASPPMRSGATPPRR